MQQKCHYESCELFCVLDARVRALAAAWSRKDHGLANSFLLDKTKFGLVEVLKALTLLDSSRRIRVEEKKLKRLQMQKNDKVRPKIMGKFKSQIDNLTAVKPKVRFFYYFLHLVLKLSKFFVFHPRSSHIQFYLTQKFSLCTNTLSSCKGYHCRSFSYFPALLWNPLALQICHLPSISSFPKAL